MRYPVILLLAFAFSSPLFAADAPQTGTYYTSFDIAAPYATANVIAKRMTLGEVYRGTVKEAARQGINLNAHTVDPREETWDIYVPTNYDGSKSYGVLVWIPSSPAFKIPEDWENVMDQHNLIFIAARGSGDNEPVRERRAPLALHGLNGIAHTYNIDPKRLYIGGNSGGAVVAGNMALAFADIFAGAVLMGDGPEPGTLESPVPVKSLLMRARQNHYALLAGQGNQAARRSVLDAQQALNALCIDQVVIINRPASGENGLLDTGLNYVTQPRLQVTAGACVSELQASAQEAVARVRQLIESNELEAASEAWRETYLQYGGLVDERMHELKITLDAKKQQRAPSTSLSKY